MKDFLRSITWPELKQSLTATLQRFPIAVLALVVQTVVLVLFIAEPNLFDENIVAKMVLTLTFLALISVSFRLIFESRWFDAMAGSLLLALGYWFSLPNSFTEITHEFAIIHLAIHFSLALSLLFAPAVGPWLRGEYRDHRFYNFVITTGLYLLQAVVIGFLVFLAGAAVIGSVKLLFDPGWLGEQWFVKWQVISASLVAPLFFLAAFPKALPEKLAVAERFLHFLIRYVAMPFICIYFIILYAYTLKVLLNFNDWPPGVVAWLVIWFSFFGYITYIISYHLSGQSTLVARFRTLIPVLLLPQLVMLFYAIGLRINQYAWTVNRYLVVALGVWLLIVSLYLIIRQQKAKLVVIPATLFFSILLILIGPWGMFNVSESSQVRQLNKIMSVAQISDEESRSASSIIRYLCQYHGCHSVYRAEMVKAKLAPNHKDYQEIEKELQLPAVHDLRSEISHYYTDRKTALPLNIAGYSKLWEISYNQNDLIYYDNKKQRLVIEGAQIDIGKQLADLAKQADINNQLTQSDFIIRVKGIRYKVFIKHLTLEHGIYNLNGWIVG